MRKLFSPLKAVKLAITLLLNPTFGGNSHLRCPFHQRVKSEGEIEKVVKLSDRKIEWIVRHCYIEENVNTREAIVHASNYNILIIDVNTDRGSQFYADKGAESKFQFLVAVAAAKVQGMFFNFFSF